MIGEEEDTTRLSGIARKRYLRSASWTDRSPSKPSTSSNPRPQVNGKTRSSFLPPLSITRRNVEEWPTAGSDDLGIWPHPQTPRGSSSDHAMRELQLKRDKLAFFDKDCSKIADHIYLGSEAVARNREILRRNEITHVLNCVGFVCPEFFKTELAYKTLWLRDSPSEDITSVLYDVFDYFEDVRGQNGRVFVHCCQGVSRSTSLVIAYLMWQKGQSFEDAFQFVKAARGVTNPNMGFACQLLQCQKRVHAVPASPNSTLRVYRMAPHSPYDPLHLVPKTVQNPAVKALDSRGAFIVHLPSALYVWSGKYCGSVMTSNARAAAFQVMRYEQAQGPICVIEEGDEPAEFWDAFETNLPSEDVGKIGKRKVGEYDLDFELFEKALAGGVVPPFPVSSAGSETRLPARENGWSRLRRKLAIGLVKELTATGGLTSDMVVDSYEEVEKPGFCGSPDSFECFPNGSPDRIAENDTGKPVDHNNPFSPASCDSSDSFSYFPDTSPNFSSKSPTLSPSTSDYASSFSFSPSSSNWSDLSYLPSQQPSPSGLDSSADPNPVKNASFLDSSKIRNKESYGNHSFRSQITCTPSIAERRGSNPPPMLLPSESKSRKVPRNLVRSWSFSTPDMDDEEMKESEYSESENEEQMLDTDVVRSETTGKDCGDVSLFSGEIVNKAETVKPAFYKLPSMDELEGFCVEELDSRSSYAILLARESSLHSESSVMVMFWLGNRSDTSNNGDILGETIGHDFLNRMDLPLDTPVQVVREGEETEQFLNHTRI